MTLEQCPQWIVWRAVPLADGRTDKVPTHPQTGKPTNAHDPSLWVSLPEAQQQASALGGPPFGVGFVFAKNDPYFFIDIDDCLQDDGTWAPIVYELIGLLPGVAVEVSQSGRGIHLVGSGQVTADRKIKAGKLFDLYTDGRFMALGRGLQGDVTVDQTAGLQTIVDRWLLPDPVPDGAIDTWTTEAVAEWRGPDDDSELLKRAYAARGAANVFGGGISFQQLWEADGDALGEKWPDPHGVRAYDESIADSALAQHLAFWTGNNCERIERMMLTSGLARDKWVDRPAYLRTTIVNVVQRQDNVYQERQAESRVEGVTTEPAHTAADGTRPGYQLMTINQQIEYFANCVYVADVHKVFMGSGKLRRPEQFRSFMGGWKFALDMTAEKTTKSAWEAFTESQGYRFPKVEELRFRPKEKPGEIGVDDRGISYVNSYVPQFGRTSTESAQPFLDHVERLVPVERDREILLSYLAACVQMAGTKFQWCLVLQGVQGNGKTILWTVLEHALGQRYCHQASPKDLESVFNAWLENRLMIGIEEIRVGNRRDLADAIKPLITNCRVPLQAKGVDQYTADNCANFLLFSNRHDAVLKSENDRRYCVVYSAQQEATDLARDHMGTKYFDQLFDWLRNQGGLEAVAGYLWTRSVDVHVQGRAPRTTSTQRAIAESLGPAEQIVLEAIECEEPGFRGGLLCSRIVRSYLAANNLRMTPRTIASVLRRLGYLPHPCLEQRKRLKIDGIRRYLYVQPNHPIAAVEDLPTLAEIWRKAQTEPV